MLISWIFILGLLYLGNLAATRTRVLRALNFPGSLVGGIVGGIVLLILRSGFSTQLEIPAGPRDLLLVFFFVCSGLAMTTASWKEAGSSLLPLSALCALFIVLQNVVGIVAAWPFGLAPIYGVMSGSVAYCGGLGSAVAWGEEAVAKGASRAIEIGIISATLGLLISALISGPYVAFVIKRDRLKGTIEPEDGALGAPSPASPQADTHSGVREERRFTEAEVVMSLLLICLSLYAGDILGGWAGRFGLVFPRFLSAMLVGVLISLGLDRMKVKFDRALVDKMGSIFLNIFIVMTLSGVELWKLKGAVGSVLVVAAAQTVVMIALVHLTIYRPRGRNYESLAIAGGFLGFMLGSFAVAMATVRNTEQRFGPAPRAALLVTLIGGAVSNFANAIITLVFFKWLL
jgi:ESS family glutamate:Na+ symporter